MLLAEAEVPYDQVFETEDINGGLGQADVTIILSGGDAKKVVEDTGKAIE